MRRCQDVLTDGSAEIEFRRFVQIVQESCTQWQATTAEAQRLQSELDNLQHKFDDCLRDRSDFETKLFHARRLLEFESKARRQLEEKLSTVCDLLHTEPVIDKTKIHNTLESLNMSMRKRKPRLSRQLSEDPSSNEINSTCSFLSDLSVTLDNLLDITKPFKRRCPSNMSPNTSFTRRLRRRVSVAASCEDEIEPVLDVFNHFDRIPDLKQNNEHVDDESEQSKSSASTVKLSSNNKENEADSPRSQAITKQSKLKNDLNLLNFQVRQHEFTTRTVLRSESCAYCSKKFSFGKTVLKCRPCGIYLHQECKIWYTKSCVPKLQGKLISKQGYIADYVGTESPMIPPLTTHCIREVESRGLSEKGIYRISGSDKEIKSLKSRFLNGKPIQNLRTLDIHVVCGCIKDFLWGLKEPLIPHNLWIMFSNAVQFIEDAEIERELKSAIDQLPNVNRDTLAILILHLQRVSKSVEAQMPIDTLAKVFGPTVIGYSSDDPDHHAIFAETPIQKDVMENLLKLSVAYWEEIICPDANVHTRSRYPFFGTTNKQGEIPIRERNVRKEKTFFSTPPKIDNILSIIQSKKC